MHAGFYEPSDSVGDGSRLAGARASNHEHRPTRRRYYRVLLGIKCVLVVDREARGRCAPDYIIPGHKTLAAIIPRRLNLRSGMRGELPPVVAPLPSEFVTRSRKVA